MTMCTISGNAHPMLLKVWSLLLIVIASSLMVTATVHAQELPGTLTMECSGAVHTEGDADQSQGDSDQAVPHHHSSCHGASLNVPASDGLSAVYLSDMRPSYGSDSATASRLVDPALRPPSA
jgi:hypothetical protein